MIKIGSTSSSDGKHPFSGTSEGLDSAQATTLMMLWNESLRLRVDFDYQATPLQCYLPTAGQYRSRHLPEHVRTTVSRSPSPMNHTVYHTSRQGNEKRRHRNHSEPLRAWLVGKVIAKIMPHCRTNAHCTSIIRGVYPLVSNY